VVDDQEEPEDRVWGGAREGAGRPKGRPSLRRAAQAIAEVGAAWPGWSPVLHLATVANDESLPVEIRLDAAKAAAPYLHSRPKPVEMEPDALVELERRLIAAKVEAAVATLYQPGLAERLQRAHARVQIPVDTGVMHAPADFADVTPNAPPAEPQARPATAALGDGNAYSPVTEPPSAPAPTPCSPILSCGPAVSADWSAFAPAPHPQRQAFADAGCDFKNGSYKLP
jgi:hypothetical protein